MAVKRRCYGMAVIFYRIQVTAVAVKRHCYGMAVIFTESRSQQWLSNVTVTAWQLFLPNPGHGIGCETSLLRHGGYFYRIQVTALAVKHHCYGMALILTESRSQQWLSNVAVTAWRLFFPRITVTAVAVKVAVMTWWLLF